MSSTPSGLAPAPADPAPTQESYISDAGEASRNRSLAASSNPRDWPRWHLYDGEWVDVDAAISLTEKGAHDDDLL
jgi:hypothetical protein